MPLTQLLNAIICDDEPVSPSVASANVNDILRAVRDHLGMDVAFAAHVTPTHSIIENMDVGEDAPFAVGDAFPVEEGYCKRILDERLPPLIHDAAAFPEVAKLACTLQMPIGAHLSVPLRLADGTLYGTFCCFSGRPNHTLNERDVEVMRAFADIAASQIDAGLADTALHTGMIDRISDLIAHDGPSVVYQPIYDLASNQMAGVECLARFPDADMRGPDKWFAEAAEVGLGPQLEMAAIRTALKGIQHIPDDVYLAVNVSPATLLGGHLESILEEFAPGRLVLEVTEHAIIRDYALFKQALEPLRPRVRIAIDDVGAGYSGLSHILDIRPDIIKLDMNLTRDIDKDPARAALARALITFADELGSSIVAEGIETSAELVTLKALGVHAGQGYYLQRPKPIAALENCLVAHKLGCAEHVARKTNLDSRPVKHRRQMSGH